MARKPDPYADPVRVSSRSYPSGGTVYRARIYPAGVVTENPNDRQALPPLAT